jgi:hypothetical protein
MAPRSATPRPPQVGAQALTSALSRPPCEAFQTAWVWLSLIKPENHDSLTGTGYSTNVGRTRTPRNRVSVLPSANNGTKPSLLDIDARQTHRGLPSSVFMYG